ncbi:MAG: PilZ domain-containing protein [Xanthomonadales bacterium]|nr:PilZ domain-containing protein [Xanthomonadales bacterium]MCB1634788.1 PilZ domain-containing protein [Xanthomonadales bacterium]MCB1641480.1 PilZ domain-containing protein [Xanthomonadales bacterium]
MHNDAAGMGRRPSRMPIRSAVLVVRGDESWTSDVADISATGVRIDRPADWVGEVGDLFVLDMLFDDTLNINVEARVARVSDEEVGFVFARIPPDKEVPLWNLLGRHADQTERWD